MAKLTRLQALGLQALLEKFFSARYLNICIFHDIERILGHHGISRAQFTLLRALHCTDWHHMRPELRAEIRATVWGAFRPMIDAVVPPPAAGPEKDITPPAQVVEPLMLETVVAPVESEQPSPAQPVVRTQRQKPDVEDARITRRSWWKRVRGAQ